MIQMQESINREGGSFIQSVDFAKEAVMRINVEHFEVVTDDIAEEEDAYGYNTH